MIKDHGFEDEPWTELEYCEKHEYETLPCRDCKIVELQAQLESVRSATECIGHDRDCTWHSGSGMCVCGLDELQAALEEVSDDDPRD